MTRHLVDCMPPRVWVRLLQCHLATLLSLVFGGYQQYADFGILRLDASCVVTDASNMPAALALNPDSK